MPFLWSFDVLLITITRDGSRDSANSNSWWFPAMPITSQLQNLCC